LTPVAARLNAAREQALEGVHVSMLLRQTSAIARNALVIIAVILSVAALRWLGEILNPLLIAMFLAVMVDGFSRVIRRRLPGLPAGTAVLAAIAIASLIFVLCAVVVAANASGFLNSLAGAEPKINRVITQLCHALRVRNPGTIDHMMRHLDHTQYLGSVATMLQGVISSVFLVLVYLGFLIASRHAFERKTVRLFRSREDRQHALQVFLRVRDAVERYLWIQTVTGLIIAAASWVVMIAVGLDNALFWAFLIFIVNYIPIIGAAAAIVLPAVFALIQLDGYLRATLLLGALFAITFVVGNILLPRMQGDSLNLDPLIVLLSLAFWGAVWGLTGMFLSTPLTVLAMVILAQFDGSRWIAVLLSADGDPQRLGRGFEHSPDEAVPAR
jgi:predicted PurR-regulated permease PerM